MTKKQISLTTNPLNKTAPPAPAEIKKPAVVKKAPKQPVKHTEVPDEEVEKFILAGEKPPAGYKLTKQAVSSKMRRAERGERLSIYIPDALFTQLRMYCAKENCSKSHAVTIALQHLLEENDNP